MQTGTDDSKITKQERVIRKVKALLAIAERDTTPAPERQAAREQAERLILRHSIDQAQLDDKSGERGKPVSEVIAFFPQYWKEHMTLMHNVYAVFRCETVAIQTGHGKTEALIDTIGFPQDLALAWTMFQSLDQQMTREMFAGKGSVAFRKSFASAFTYVVIDRLKKHYLEALEDAEESGTGSELVMYNRSQLVTAARDEMYPQLRNLPRSEAATSDIFGALSGADAGLRADILLDDHKVEDDHENEDNRKVIES